MGLGTWQNRLGESMSGEILAILAVGVALAGVILTSIRGLRQDMARLESRLDERINGLESRFDAMEKQFGELRERMAHLEGLLEGLREAITGRVSAS